MAPPPTTLYGAPRPSKPAPPSDLTFSTALSSLISTSTSTSTSSSTLGPHPRPPRRNPTHPQDSHTTIFTRPNRNMLKRQHADQVHSTSTTSTAPISGEEDWELGRRRLAKKARTYAAMKRGDLDDEDGKFAVDFDRKWAETANDAAEAGSSDSPSSDDDDGGGEDEDEEKVKYTDELGRTRLGTAHAAAIASHHLSHHLSPSSSTILRGDTLQTAAFNADTPAITSLASKRDRSATPPPVSRYDASAEVRRRGTGFFRFSADEDERARQMRGLEGERAETERARGKRESESGGRGAREGREGGGSGEGRVGEGEEAETPQGRRKREVEERRRLIQLQRERKAADVFLREMGGDGVGGRGGGNTFVRASDA
ncbi:MAG: hypothetical protein M1828_003299 [Chrysothrix sp. TS-e1954]|nr:MAG: hypothetical protein M1828_003299 [Chrysothrix sp. TS-e1954]